MDGPTGDVELIVRIEEGPQTRVGRVVVEGRTRRPLWKLSQAIALDAGDILDLDDLDAVVQSLLEDYRKARYLDAKVEVVDIRAPTPSRPRQPGVPPVADVIIRIDAGPQVEIRFRGNTAVTTQTLEADAELLEELGTAPTALAEVRERIVNRYERRGYWRVEVAPAVRVNVDRSRKQVLFSIRENERSIVRHLTFPGNQLLDRDVLVDTVVAAVQDALGDAAGRPGANPAVVDSLIGQVRTPGSRRQPDTSAPDPRQVYMPRAYRAALDQVADLYRARGYQMVEVDEPIVERVKGQDMVDVALPIRPGIRWRVANVLFDGNTQVTSLELLELAGLDLSQSEGQALAFDDVERARSDILKRYRDDGFLYVQ
ncbi:MAG: POTRA domain-containing protein, partial [Myxococcota bacterium]